MEQTVQQRKPANDNRQRPASFDARVMAYLPGLRSLARKSVSREYIDDLVTDTVIYALEHWAGFREDGGFWNWLSWCMRAVRRAQAAKATAEMRAAKLVSIDMLGPTLAGAFTVAPDQETKAELAKAIDTLGTIRHGDVLLRRCMGEGLREIGLERGITRNRVHQIEIYAREKLLKKVAA